MPLRHSCPVEIGTNFRDPDFLSGVVVVSPVPTKNEDPKHGTYLLRCCRLYCDLLMLVFCCINVYFWVGLLHNFIDDFIHKQQRETLLWGVGLGSLFGGARRHVIYFLQEYVLLLHLS